MSDPRLAKLAAYRSALLAERARRLGTGKPVEDHRRSWARSYAGRPVEFIGEVMGPTWWTEDWAAWRAFVRSVFGLPIPEDEWPYFTAATGRTQSPDKRQRGAWAIVGRRGGKSRTLASIGIYLACCEDWTPYLVPGELGFVRVLANIKPNAHAIMGYVKAALKHPKLAPLLVKELAESVELLGSVAIEVGVASIGAVRARTIVAALADEIAFWDPDEDSANPDAEILNALRPAMLTIPTGMILGASSPYARKGVLWDAFERYFGKNDAPLVWKAQTLDMHPSADREEIDRAYEEDPEAAAAEYGAEFRRDIAAFVTREAIRAVTMSGRYEMPPSPGYQYRAFVDPSGGASDSMTLAIAHSEGDVGVLDALREVRPPFSPDAVVADFASDCHRYGVACVTGDHYAGEWPRERFRVRGISYEVSEDSKSVIYQTWLPLVNAGRVELLDEARLIAQACALERRTSRVGRDAIDHAPGGHDDVVNAAAGALVLATSDIYPALWTPERLTVVQ